MHGTSLLRPIWYPDWSADVCAVVASGESVKAIDLRVLKDRCKVLVVNNNYQLAPWADALYAADKGWWEQYRDALRFAGLKITHDSNFAAHHNLHRVELLEEEPSKSVISVDRPGHLARGGHSGFQAINLATQFGSRRQIWIGFDLHGEHWHGKHEGRLRNARPHTLARWAESLDAQAPVLAGLGVEVVNCSAVSVLAAYRKMNLDNALAHFGVILNGRPDEEAVNFDAAETYLRLARVAHALGNTAEFIAARKLVMVALRVEDVAPARRGGS